MEYLNNLRKYYTGKTVINGGRYVDIIEKDAEGFENIKKISKTEIKLKTLDLIDIRESLPISVILDKFCIAEDRSKIVIDFKTFEYSNITENNIEIYIDSIINILEGMIKGPAINDILQSLKHMKRVKFNITKESKLNGTYSFEIILKGENDYTFLMFKFVLSSEKMSIDVPMMNIENAKTNCAYFIIKFSIPSKTLEHK